MTNTDTCIKVAADPNDPIVALLDTGSYPTTAGPPAGAVGNNNLAAAEPLLGSWGFGAAAQHRGRDECHSEHFCDRADRRLR